MISSAFYCSVGTKKKTLRNHERLFRMRDYFLSFKFVLEAIREEHKIISEGLNGVMAFTVNG